jgi:hypothetical protein
VNAPGACDYRTASPKAGSILEENRFTAAIKNHRRDVGGINAALSTTCQRLQVGGSTIPFRLYREVSCSHAIAEIASPVVYKDKSAVLREEIT